MKPPRVKFHFIPYGLLILFFKAYKSRIDIRWFFLGIPKQR